MLLLGRNIPGENNNDFFLIESAVFHFHVWKTPFMYSPIKLAYVNISSKMMQTPIRLFIYVLLYFCWHKTEILCRFKG